MMIRRAIVVFCLVAAAAVNALAADPPMPDPPNVGAACSLPDQPPVDPSWPYIGLVYCPGVNWSAMAAPAEWQTWTPTLYVDSIPFSVHGVVCNAESCRGDLGVEAHAQLVRPGSHTMRISVVRRVANPAGGDDTLLDSGLSAEYTIPAIQLPAPSSCATRTGEYLNAASRRAVIATAALSKYDATVVELEAAGWALDRVVYISLTNIKLHASCVRQ